ncbi:MAG: SCP2 sterol-binding domain-containing protein [Gammaproteobacteria bacterium]|jgi:ubiquinone biosynthesis protein UbiJ|nr:SCP2 sterol-binding domain-containing protein [Gammaproteobacteria bacterium]
MLFDLLSKPAGFWLARGVGGSTTAQALCERLEGKVLQIATGVDSLNAYLQVRDGELQLQPGMAAAPDAVLTGSPFGLARLGAGDDPQALIRGGHVRLTGDEEIAAEFQVLLDRVRPDWEDELAQWVGDAPAHQLGRVARGTVGWLDKAATSLSRSAGEYLTEESRSVAAAAEIEAFCAEVDDLAAAVDRAAARLRLLQAARNAS